MLEFKYFSPTSLYSPQLQQEPSKIVPNSGIKLKSISQIPSAAPALIVSLPGPHECEEVPPKQRQRGRMHESRLPLQLGRQ